MRRRGRGVSLLLEILIGVALFGLSLLLIMGLFPGAQAASSQAKNLSLATNLARSVMEMVRSRPYDAVDTIPATNVDLSVEVNGVQAAQTFTYQVDVNVPDVAQQLKNVVVNVTWSTGGASAAGHSHGYRLQTYVVPF